MNVFWDDTVGVKQLHSQVYCILRNPYYTGRMRLYITYNITIDKFNNLKGMITL